MRRSRKKKIVLRVILTAAVCYGVYSALLYGVSYAGEKVSNHLLAKAAEKKLGEVRFIEPHFESVHPGSLKSINWLGVGSKLLVDKRSFLGDAGSSYFFAARDIKVSTLSFAFERMLISIENFKLEPRRVDQGGPRTELFILDETRKQGQIIGNHIRLMLPIESIREPKEIALASGRAFRNLLNSGQSSDPLDINAQVVFYLGDFSRTAQIRSIPESDYWRLVVSTRDIQSVSDYFDDLIGDSEGAFLSRKVARFAELMRLRDLAQQVAAAFSEQNPDYEKETSRHLLYSYLVTKAFGEVIARELGVAFAADREPDAQALVMTAIRKGRALALGAKVSDEAETALLEFLNGFEK